jgi:ribosomal subunit interface protein
MRYNKNNTINPSLHMRTVIKTTRLTLTDALFSYVEKRLSALNKYVKGFERNGELLLEAEIARTTRHHRKGEVYYVELTLRLPKKTVRIEQSHEDLRAGIDAAQKRCKLMVEEYKKKLVDKTKKGAVTRGK